MFNNGWGSPFARRSGAPESSQVFSDGEFEADWNNRLSAISPTIETKSEVYSTPQTAGFDPNYYVNANPDVKAAIEAGQFTDAQHHYDTFGKNEGRTAFGPTDSENSTFNASDYLGLNPDVQNAVNSGGFDNALQHFAIFGHEEPRAIGYRSEFSTNPAYAAMQQEMEDAKRVRGENQTMQQQAYDSMNDQYQRNGILGANYSDANFGAITGISDDGTETSGLTEGLLGNTTTTGVYDPIKSTAQTFWGL